MPAWILLMKIGKVPLPIPWFILWLVLAPLVPVAWMLGTIGRLLGLKGLVIGILEESWRLFLMITCLHGLEVNVRSSEEKVRFSFI